MGLFDKLLKKGKQNEEDVQLEPTSLDEQQEEEPSIDEEENKKESSMDKKDSPLSDLEEATEDNMTAEEPGELEETEVIEKPKKGFFTKLVAGLTKTRQNILGGVDQVLKSFGKIDEELFEELEEALIMADIGVQTTMNIVDSLKEQVRKQKITDSTQLRSLLVDEISKILEEENEPLHIDEGPTVILVIGVNGVGKTTTIGKLANQIKQQRKKVLLAAADTFRAAAIDQLKIWGDRAGVDVIYHQENADPGAVIFDAVQAAKSRKTDVLICDTAGRLHNKKNLMEELKKLFKIINRDFPEAKKEVLLVLDSTTGQNALQQAKLFKEVADITGIILTKLDGTAKGGIVLAIKSELKIPVKYIGVGEGIDDLQPFNSNEFAKALFNAEEE